MVYIIVLKKEYLYHGFIAWRYWYSIWLLHYSKLVIKFIKICNKKSFLCRSNFVMRYINGLIFNPILIDKHVSCSILYTANNFVQENLQCDSCEDLLSTAIAKYREKWNFPKDRVSSNSLILWHIDWQESCRLHFINRIQCFVIPMITLSFDFMTFINGYHNLKKQIELVIF